MNYRRMTCRVVLAGLTAALGLTAIHAAPARRATYTVRVAFDGGYVFDFGQAQSVDVFALKEGGLPLKAEVEHSALPQLDLQGAVLTLEPDGKAPSIAKPAIPPKGAKPADCDKDADSRQPNNWYFIPSLADVAERMGTTLKSMPDRYGTIRLSGGGAVVVKALGGCVEYRDRGSVEQRSIASGVRGIVYEWADIPGSFMQLRIRHEDGRSDTTHRATPDAEGRITIHVTSFLGPPSDGGHVHDLADFWKHFGPIFSSTVGTRRISLSWTRAYDRSPGIDCPPGSTGS